MALKERVKAEIDLAMGDATYLDIFRRSGIDPGYAHRLTKKPLNLTLDTLERVASALGYEVEITFKRAAAEKIS